MKVGVPKGSAKTVGGVLLAVINGHYIKNRAYTTDTHRVSVVYTMGHTGNVSLVGRGGGGWTGTVTRSHFFFVLWLHVPFEMSTARTQELHG